MIGRLLGVVLVLVPVGLLVWYFGYWIKRRERRDLIIESKKEK